jgi:hypothetical protein
LSGKVFKRPYSANTGSKAMDLWGKDTGGITHTSEYTALRRFRIGFRWFGGLFYYRNITAVGGKILIFSSIMSFPLRIYSKYLY